MSITAAAFAVAGGLGLPASCARGAPALAGTRSRMTGIAAARKDTAQRLLPIRERTIVLCSLLLPALLRLFPGQVAIDGCDEHVGGPGAAGCAIDGVIVKSGFGRLYLLEGHSLLHQGLDPPANDGDHIAIVHHVVPI